ncbi:hypothetical protein ABER99_21810 [Paenibacillus glucanolyticus]|uniref:Myb-like domain-containing protein n=1 Tax=Paenibacillus glucanolyticus TaxID=59843 RepID=A0A163GQ24_9BACL|nr:hypothetical protein [Paenibacillus glucanolyticus]KZS45086.1 hypothetical protein AWU65_03650 [Paenibacillus glucanolyticus]OMF65493.1 hypothetical protein BK142_30845 [Paenibacillus glucanolyticus]
MSVEAIKRHRQRDWSNQEDSILTEIVLDHMRLGETQLKAFQRASEELEGRTPGACGFRWNSELRKKTKELIEAAKEHKKKLSLTKTTRSIETEVENKQQRIGKQRGVRNRAKFELLEQLLSPERVNELSEYIKALSSNLGLFQTIREALEKKDREIHNLKETNASLQEQIKRLEYLEENWREFSTFAERFKKNG